MSGSSRASCRLSRCVVTLDAGVSISWEPDPDGSFEAGADHHRDEEASFRRRIEDASTAIEALFEALEDAGHRFAPVDEAGTKPTQWARHGMLETCELELCATPPLSDAAMTALVGQIAALTAAGS